jgi:hypothetical protein
MADSFAQVLVKGRGRLMKLSRCAILAVCAAALAGCSSSQVVTKDDSVQAIGPMGAADPIGLSLYRTEVVAAGRPAAPSRGLAVHPADGR